MLRYIFVVRFYVKSQVAGLCDRSLIKIHAFDKKGFLSEKYLSRLKKKTRDRDYNCIYIPVIYYPTSNNSRGIFLELTS